MCVCVCVCDPFFPAFLSKRLLIMSFGAREIDVQCFRVFKDCEVLCLVRGRKDYYCVNLLQN